ncbi:MAG: riboflavin synthase subunit alpha [Euryarchaeota archaeon]|jgi:riboflavin synthase|nr:riboflavin synthase subunit alpha [Euryarchaeota archaeon]MBT4924334.1 riboflavin synthase subunit alpha [Euryarchaeota archaeon]MBT5735413.1 riboflavin synthase subunit alpha [Euryarchaeota archaeon]MBT7460393.1 riboflavin synthase subunit alpha [Euryarchaeota archaeon]
MFTGIVQGTGKIIEVIEGETIRSFKIQVPNTESLEIGASISVDGVCLTATSIENKIVSFDVIQETLKRTTLGQLEVGETVNIERSLKFGDEIGGHLLSGHIMATGIVNEKSESGEGMDFTILAPLSIEKYLLEKGYVAIDGISLTIGDVNNSRFNLHIIPETMRQTTIASKQVGDAVNIEIDSTTQTIVSTVERMTRKN